MYGRESYAAPTVERLSAAAERGFAATDSVDELPFLYGEDGEGQEY